MIIKADQFATWHAKFVDKLGVAAMLPAAMNLRGRDTVREWGEQLKGEHRPTNPMELPDFMAPKVVTSTSQSISHNAVLAASVRSDTKARNTYAPTKQPSQITAQNDIKSACCICGKALTPKVAKFCLDNAGRFGGKLYCYNHQADAK